MDRSELSRLVLLDGVLTQTAAVQAPKNVRERPAEWAGAADEAPAEAFSPHSCR